MAKGGWRSLIGSASVWVCVGASIGCGEPRRIARAPQNDEAGTLATQVVHHSAASASPRVEWRDGARERAPMRLTAGDGTGLRLASVRGTVVIEDPLAFTELHLRFENPENRRREGRFEIDLPPGAALSRLAMRIGDRLMEGEIVERRAGQATYESYVHERPNVDPMLLETTGDGRVAARVFPIEPLQAKEIVVSYSQVLSGGPYRLPLDGLSRMDELAVQVVVKTHSDPGAAATVGRTIDQRVIEVSQTDVAPSEDLVVALSEAGDAAAIRSGKLAVLRVRPDAPERSAPLHALTILFDTSASAAGGFDREVDRLVALLAELGDAPVRVVAFDQTTEVLFEGPASLAGADVRAGIRERRAFGASNLHAALSDPAVRRDAHPRLLLWTDGVATAGPVARSELASAATALAGAGVLRIDVVRVHSAHDAATLQALVGAAPWGGRVIGPDVGGDAIATRLRQASWDDVAIAVEGAAWSWPTSLGAHAPGDDITVYAAFEAGAPEALRVDFSGGELASHVIVAREGEAPLVDRAVAWAQIQDEMRTLDAIGDDEPMRREGTRARIVELSTRHRVLSDYTALLVLESEAEYRRFGIERTALADILAIGPGGVTQLRRGEVTTLPPAPRHDDARIAAIGSAFAVGNDGDVWGGLSGGTGSGGLGFVGTGRGGGGTSVPGSLGTGDAGTIGLGSAGVIGAGSGSGTGSGYGRGSGAGFGGRGIGLGSAGTGDVPGLSPGWWGSRPALPSWRGKAVPIVRVAKAEVRGALDKDIVRRIVRAHINEVRHCYDQGLARRPDLAGGVSVRFRIESSGKVSTASVASTTLADPLVGECIAKATRRWRFPAPTGAVEVVYPFVLGDGRGVAVAQRPRPRRPSKRKRAHKDPWAGRYASVHELLARTDTSGALDDAFAWASASPDDTLAIVALGEALQAGGRTDLAARVYGSLVDLHPHRADMRRAAAARLAALGDHGLSLAIDSAEKAVALRPDHPSGHRQLAWALARAGRLSDAFAALEQGLAERWPRGRFAGVRKVMREDLALVAAAWRATTHDPAAVDERLRAAGVRPDTSPTLRLVAHWETDATDIDLAVKPLQRGGARGRKLADVRTGFGPEAWVVRGTKRPRTVTASVHYYERGAMGAALGTVEAIAHDGHGGLAFQSRPFVITEAGGALDLGELSL
jgi:hypothetical protein